MNETESSQVPVLGSFTARTRAGLIWNSRLIGSIWFGGLIFFISIFDVIN